MKKPESYFVSLLFLVMLSSCTGVSTDNKQTIGIADMTSLDTSIIKKSLENIYYLFPSPTDVLTAIKQGGLFYEPNLLNSIEKRDKYVKPNDQFLNLGIYLADLSYCALFSRNNDAEAYLETIKRMSIDLNLSSVINNGFINKVNDRNYSVDSLVNITDKYFFKLVTDLEDNNRQNDLAIITIGSYIECLYLSVNSAKTQSVNNLIQYKVAEQKHAFNNLYKYCQRYIPSDELAKTFSYIKQINDAFGQFGEFKEELKVVEESKNHHIISGGNIPVIKDSEFKSFKEQITKIRNSITK